MEDDRRLESERRILLRQIEDLLEWPLIILAFLWLVLMVLEFTSGLSPFLETAGYVIWGIFIVEFLVRFAVAPGKFEFLKQNWLTLISLVLPAIRVLRFIRFVRVFRGIRLVRVVASVNRGMGALRRSMARRGLGYVVAITLVVLLAGAAGMYEFEREHGLHSYPEALWWTSMLLTTIGSEYWPRTVEGRMLTFLLSLYALGILGYVAATLATFFIGRDAESGEGEVAGEHSLRELRDEIRQLRNELNRH